jgi:hypothetical protein
MINPKFPVMELAAAGLIPIFPTIEVVPVDDIPVFVNIVKLPAVPRSTAGCSADTIKALDASEMSNAPRQKNL